MTPNASCWKALASALLVAACGPANDAGLSPERREARRLYFEGMDHAMRLDYGATMQSLTAALAADPSYLPALGDFWFDVGHSVRTAVVLDSVAGRASDPGIARCLRRAAANYRGVKATLAPSPPRESVAARWCSFHVRTSYEFGPTPAERDSIRMLGELFPESQSQATRLITALSEGADTVAIRRAVRAVRRQQQPPAPRASALAALALALHEMGDDSGAVELERAAMRDPAWALPGFRLLWASQMMNHGGIRRINRLADPTALLRHIDSTLAAMIAIRVSSSGRGDLLARLSIRTDLGVEALDRGRLDEAVRFLTAAVPLADSLRDTGSRAYVYMRLGRALVKAGRAPEAERILLVARALGDSAGIPRERKETEHNLLHLYESLGRDTDALHAGEEFVRFASAGLIDPVRMMSARDVGLFLRARGRVEESRRYFQRMLADIDSLKHEWYYAGEYHETTGALDDALVAYQRAVDRSEEPMRALAGLARVTLSMGDTVAARRWASMHDARRDAAGRPEAAPLLPAVLRRTADGAVARHAFMSAREDVARHSQVSAWASLTTDLSALEHDLGNFHRAGQLADSAEDAARRVGEAETVLRARALAASARARGSEGADARVAVGAIAAIAKEADRSGGILVRADVHRLVAGALASSGQWREALSEYRRAVIPLDSIAGRIAMDPGQAAFRSAQRRAYDEALFTIARNASQPGAVAEWAAWSARRKGRTYAVQWPVDRGGIPRVSGETAIVDYVLLDTLVAALVVSGQVSTIVSFEVKPRQVRSDAEALRRAVDVRVGSSLDVRRARFPMDIAHRLYRTLLAPLDPYLTGARTLIVVPDGILSLVPFDALVTALPRVPWDYRSARYMLDERVVLNATTIRTASSAWQVTPRRITIVDPGTAPAAAREVEAITNALPRDAVRSLRGPAATRAGTIAAMRDADVIHFVAHAQANEHDPASSRIDLSPADGDDGRLDASTVASLQLDAPLVVLSACETANGRVLDGEGVLSMSRSFLRAGARATVATLWPVGPSAADFVAAFYLSVAKSRDAAEALRNAKLAMRAQGAPPSVWAPYQLFAAPSSGAPGSIVVAAKHEP